MSAVAEQLKFTSLDSAVISACEMNPADSDAAAECLLGILAQDKRLYDQSHNYLIEMAVKDLVSSKITAQRRGLFREAPVKNQSNACLRKLSSVIAARVGLLNYALKRAHKVLADATIQDLKEEAAMHRSKAQGNTSKAAWLESIVEHMQLKNAETVADALDHQDLLGLAMKAGVSDLA